MWQVTGLKCVQTSPTTLRSLESLAPWKRPSTRWSDYFTHFGRGRINTPSTGKPQELPLTGWTDICAARASQKPW